MEVMRRPRLPEAVHERVRHVATATVKGTTRFPNPCRSPRTIMLNSLVKTVKCL